MDVRWLLASILLLAGCASPASTQSLETAPPPVPAEAYTIDFEGRLVGAGYVTPVQTGFLGISSRAHTFDVPEGFKRLTATLTWQTPAVVYLSVHGPGDTAYTDHQLPDAALRQSITYSTDAAAGEWALHAWAQGPAVLDYQIQLLVEP